MTGFEREGGTTTSGGGRCDTRVWSGACEKSDYREMGEKYLCTACGTLTNLTHEVRHEVFPLVSGDYDNLG